MGECSSYYVLLPVDKANYSNRVSLDTGLESVKSTLVQCDDMVENIRSQVFVDIDFH